MAIHLFLRMGIALRSLLSSSIAHRIPLSLTPRLAPLHWLLLYCYRRLTVAFGYREADAFGLLADASEKTGLAKACFEFHELSREEILRNSRDANSKTFPKAPSTESSAFAHSGPVGKTEARLNPRQGPSRASLSTAKFSRCSVPAPTPAGNVWWVAILKLLR